MKLLRRNLTPIWYCLYKGRTEAVDEDGNETGEPVITYHDPVKLLCNVSPARGSAQIETFGTLESYDKVIITDDMSCPIKEDTLLFVDKEPEYMDETPVGFDYKVNRVAKSLNHISIAISKVNYRESDIDDTNSTEHSGSDQGDPEVSEVASGEDESFSYGAGE